jgi:beta-lactamase superfamily II metal-dependent hydrolase
MSIIKSFSVGNGDSFYIRHNSPNFTMIDCRLVADRRDDIVEELLRESSGKEITRFIATHPDEDHILGLKHLHEHMPIANFYCVANDATKSIETEDFKQYRELHDDEKKRFYLYRGCTRKWMNEGSPERAQSGIHIRWPIVDNPHFKEALACAKGGGTPNNISPIVKYSVEGGPSVLWMGDLETDFMDKVANAITMDKADILFAPHHGRASARLPQKWLDEMAPKLIVIGEADCDHLDYHDGYNTITQNSAGDIVFDCAGAGKVHVYVGSSTYGVDHLDNEHQADRDGTFYIGTLNVG